MNDSGTMTITECTISNNSANQSSIVPGGVSQGGGIVNESGGSLIITNSTISSNTSSATNGDAFLLHDFRIRLGIFLGRLGGLLQFIGFGVELGFASLLLLGVAGGEGKCSKANNGR